MILYYTTILLKCRIYYTHMLLLILLAATNIISAISTPVICTISKSITIQNSL